MKQFIKSGGIFIAGMLMTLSHLAHADPTPKSQQRSSFSQWSHNRLYLLDRAKNNAWVHYTANDHVSSIAILKDGLRSASENQDPSLSGALTIKSIKRGIIITDAIETHISHEPNSLRVLNYFLFKYYDFIKNVAHRLDRPFYRGRRCHRYGGYCQSDYEKMERTFIRFAFEQTRMVLSHLAIPSNGQIYPKGSARTFLISLQYMSEWTAQDLEGSIYSHLYACRIEGLYGLSDDLESFNRAGNSYGYPNEVIAVNRFYHTAKNLSHSSNRSCGDIRPPRNGDFDEDRTSSYSLISRPIYVAKGNPNFVSLRNRDRYIKKLIIAAEGVRNDAKFEVIVNKENKGTIYVPGRDPIYTVTIEDYASSIEFSPDFGKAKINSIQVVIDLDNSL